MNEARGLAMMTFQIIGAVFLMLFFAAAMSGESTQRR
jgi:hypothetical protein